jgi:hypothetical protein
MGLFRGLRLLLYPRAVLYVVNHSTIISYTLRSCGARNPTMFLFNLNTVTFILLPSTFEQASRA